MSHNVPNELPGDLGAHDPRRMTHPDQNQPGSGGHEVKLGSNEAKGVEGGASAAEHSRDGNPRSDNTAAHALEGGSTETMDRAKRQHNSDITGGRTGHDSYEDAQTRGGLQQESTRGSGYDNSSSIRGPGQEHNYTREQELGGVGSGLTGSHTGHHHGSHTGSGLTGSTGTGLTGSHTGHHTGSNTGLTGGLTGNQSGTEPVSGLKGSGVAGEPYDAGNVQSSGFGGSDPQTRHQLHHGDPHHQHDFSHQHTTRTGELLDPASGRDTGIPGYAGQGASGLTGSSTGTGLTGSSTGTGLTGSHTGHHTSHTGTGEGILREGERAVGAGGAGYGSSTGSGLTGSNTHGTHGTSGLTGSHGTSGVTGSHTGTGYGQSTGDRLREDVREGERAIGSGNTTHGSTGSGLTGSHTGSGVTGSHTTGTGHNTSSTGERLREDVREGEQYATGRDTTGSHTTGSHTTGSHTTGTDTTGTDTTAKKPSLMDRLNPLKDADHDGKKGFMD